MTSFAPKYSAILRQADDTRAEEIELRSDNLIGKEDYMHLLHQTRRLRPDAAGMRRAVSAPFVSTCGSPDLRMLPKRK
jgi:hypothetical protein